MSVHPGICHACGHDVHTAILIGVGMVLSRLLEQGQLVARGSADLPAGRGDQPRRRVGRHRGGALTDVSEVYALHCDPRTEVGQLAFKVGPITAAVDRVKIILTGAGGHTSRPHLTADLVGALEPSPRVRNCCCPDASIRAAGFRWYGAGSTPEPSPTPSPRPARSRARSERWTTGWQLAKQLVPELAEQIVAPFQVGIKVSVTDGVPPAINHSVGVRRMIRATTEMLGSSAVTGTEQSLGGEDFSWMLQQRPGALARLGVRPPEWRRVRTCITPISRWTSCIPIGLKVLAELATSEAPASEQSRCDRARPDVRSEHPAKARRRDRLEGAPNSGERDDP